jgi:predicted membrane-bound spermidine synthase
MNKPDLLSGTRTSQPRFGLILVVAVLSVAMLAYELLLTRIASVLLTNQYVFLILGVSLLGISAGAILEYWLAQRQDRRIDLATGVWLIGSAGALVLALVLKLFESRETVRVWKKM